MIRTLLVAACTTLALASAGVGTASAATPKLSSNDDVGTCVLEVAGTTCVIKTGPLKDQTCTLDVAGAIGAVCTKTRKDDGHNNGTHPGNGNGNGHNDRWDGRNRYIDWDGGGRLDVCGNYRDFNDFSSRNSVYRNRFSNIQLNASRWDSARRANNCGGSNVVVTNNGDCVTFQNTNRDYGTRYNNRVRQLTDQYKLPTSQGGRSITRDELNRINNAADVRDFQSRWTSSRDQLRTICHEDTPPVVIVNPTPDVVVNNPAPTTVTQSAPAPSVSSPQIVTTPQGAAQTGDGSTE